MMTVIFLIIGTCIAIMLKIFNNFFLSKEFIGPLIGGLFVLFGTWLSYLYQLKARQDKDKYQLNNVLVSMTDELMEIMQRADTLFGASLSLENNQEFLENEVTVGQNYFVIYDSNASILGRLQDALLRKKIIRIYLRAKGFVDGLNQYNIYAKRRYDALLQYALLQKNQELFIKPQITLDANDTALKGITEILENEYSSIKEEILTLKDDIQKYILL